MPKRALSCDADDMLALEPPRALRIGGAPTDAIAEAAERPGLGPAMPESPVSSLASSLGSGNPNGENGVTVHAPASPKTPAKANERARPISHTASPPRSRTNSRDRNRSEVDAENVLSDALAKMPGGATQVPTLVLASPSPSPDPAAGPTIPSPPAPGETLARIAAMLELSRSAGSFRQSDLLLVTASMSLFAASTSLQARVNDLGRVLGRLLADPAHLRRVPCYVPHASPRHALEQWATAPKIEPTQAVRAMTRRRPPPYGQQYALTTGEALAAARGGNSPTMAPSKRSTSDLSLHEALTVRRAVLLASVLPEDVPQMPGPLTVEGADTHVLKLCYGAAYERYVGLRAAIVERFESCSAEWVPAVRAFLNDWLAAAAVALPPAARTARLSDGVSRERLQECVESPLARVGHFRAASVVTALLVLSKYAGLIGDHFTELLSLPYCRKSMLLFVDVLMQFELDVLAAHVRAAIAPPLDAAPAVRYPGWSSSSAWDLDVSVPAEPGAAATRWGESAGVSAGSVESLGDTLTDAAAGAGGTLINSRGATTEVGTDPLGDTRWMDADDPRVVYPALARLLVRLPSPELALNLVGRLSVVALAAVRTSARVRALTVASAALERAEQLGGTADAAARAAVLHSTSELSLFLDASTLPAAVNAVTAAMPIDIEYSDDVGLFLVRAFTKREPTLRRRLRELAGAVIRDLLDRPGAPIADPYFPDEVSAVAGDIATICRRALAG